MTLLPILPAGYLQTHIDLTGQMLVEARADDNLFEYMYLPAWGSRVPESFVLLAEPVTVALSVVGAVADDGSMRRPHRVVQLTDAGARQFQRKLISFASGDGMRPARARLHVPS